MGISAKTMITVAAIIAVGRSKDIFRVASTFRLTYGAYYTLVNLLDINLRNRA